MNAYEQLKRGMDILIQHENEFKSMLLAEIMLLVENFKPCTYNAPPEVADSLHLSLGQLNDLIAKIQDDSVINADAVKGIEKQFRDLAIQYDLRRPKPLSRTGLTVTPAAPVASVRPVPIASARPDAPNVGPINFTDRSKSVIPNWQRYANEADVPEATPVEAIPIEDIPVKPSGKPPGNLLRIGGRKTRRKV
jgi:hypothetical protein